MHTALVFIGMIGELLATELVQSVFGAFLFAVSVSALFSWIKILSKRW